MDKTPIEMTVTDDDLDELLECDSDESEAEDMVYIAMLVEQLSRYID